MNVQLLYRLIARSARSIKLVRYWLPLDGSIRKLVLARHFPFQFCARERFHCDLSATRTRRRELSTLKPQ